MQFFRDISFQEIYFVLLFACIRCEQGDKGRVIIEFRRCLGFNSIARMVKSMRCGDESF